jgi:hypothetical protein
MNFWVIFFLKTRLIHWAIYGSKKIAPNAQNIASNLLNFAQSGHTARKSIKNASTNENFSCSAVDSNET